MEELVACPSCRTSLLEPSGGSPAGVSEAVLSSVDHLASGELFHVEQCPHCGLLYTNPRPNELKIRHYYLSQDYLSHTEGRRNVTEWAYRKVRDRMIRKKTGLLKQFVSPGAVVLDIGCGTGDFLKALTLAGYKARGFEPQDEARRIALGKNLDVWGTMENLDALPGDSVEAITLWHVLEHMHNLNESLEMFDRLLVAGGFLFVAVPIHTATDARFYGSDWAAYDLPRHLYHFNRETLQKTLGAYGFSPVMRKGLPYDSYYVSLLTEKQTGKLPVGLQQLRALAVGSFSNLLAMAGRRPWSSEVFGFQKERQS